MTEKERLKKILREHNTEFCTCGHEIGFGDIAWNNGMTEDGTDNCSVEIQCVNCSREIAYFFSWYPGITNTDELLGVLEEDWKINSRSKRGSL